MAKIDIVCFAAIARNGMIGKDNQMPWHLSSDFARFKRLTMGKPQIMGRKTFESIGRPLPGRTNIIVTRNLEFGFPGCLTATTLEDAIALARADAEAKDIGEICIQGGGEIYRQAIPLADKLYITHVETLVEGDTCFPPIDPAIWLPLEEERLPAGPKDDFATRFVVYGRRL
ncbi:dihydrofolate reductase [Martelella alba]|uniref:Dihydrofolate reductase n=1 Tax=Martelella alba TaxID=2590451 RepID=A0A506UIN2_9HYPH|nr:dihydrofolate reductase [Martelella alba]TPW33170.1 dihydrofolate reductase [Martelella alba]